MSAEAFGQISFFENVDKPKEEKPQTQKTDMCLVYLVTKSGGNSGNLFVLHREDAIKLCTDECSHGSARGGQWMFQWTSLEHFRRDDAGADQHKNVHGKLEPFVFIPDTGKQDADFERLGISKPSRKEMQDVLLQLGYEMKYQGSKERLLDIGLTEEDFKETERTLKKGASK